MNEKEGGTSSKKISFNLSPSSLNVFMKNPLLFYLQYIAKVPDDTKVPVCYGLSGNIVHDCLEKYASGELDKDEVYSLFAEKWEECNLEIHRDIKGGVLDKEEYLMALLKGMSIVEEHEEHICEETINFPFVENEIMKIGIKGIVDLQARKKYGGEKVIVDYKTSNSVNQSKDFERQALFYNYLIHKKKNFLPEKTSFHYLKLGVEKVYSFSKEDLSNFEEELKRVANEILSYGKDIGKYPIGDINDLFNSKKQACLREVSRRNFFQNPENFSQMAF
ncbi:hypothetical protein AUJ84_00465 [Candidatus Pacearchaeota archaeon CG1_02_32_132]|nr:MAG: hypothetical protein AUJ84_00465 [Candidatus Pacearchaeota archaeon CG1_02_32_132]